MKEQEKLKVLRSCSLFRGLSAEELCRAAEAAEELEFPTGELLFSEGERRIGVIAKGSAKAAKPRESGAVTMALLGYGEVFGAVSIMGGPIPVTEARAKKPVTALVFSPEVFTELMRGSFALTENYCRYLISRIRFLTERVECMAGSTAEEKLLRYLTANAVDGVCRVSFGMDALAGAISISRATLYRAFSELEKNGRIARKGHEIRLL